MRADTKAWAVAIDELAGVLDALLSGVPVGAWQSPAAHVDWNCWRTAEHIAADFAHYAAQIIGQPRDHYVRFSFDTSRAMTPDQLREVVRVSAGMLAAAVRTADPDCTGWHPHGHFTAAGFAAIGAAEGLIHGHDIAAGLGMAWAPKPKLCEQVLAAVFPNAQRPAGLTALTALLIETGRQQRPRGEPSRQWSYAAAAALPASSEAQAPHAHAEPVDVLAERPDLCSAVDDRRAP